MSEELDMEKVEQAYLECTEGATPPNDFWYLGFWYHRKPDGTYEVTPIE